MKNTEINDEIAKLPSDEKRKLALEERRWQNRRRMAWVSLFMLILMTISVMYFDKQTIEVAFYVFAGLVGSYMGLATYDNFKNQDKE